MTMIAYTYARKIAAWLDAEIVTVPDQVANLDDLISAVPEDMAAADLPTNAQKFHDRAGTTFPLLDGRMARLDGEAYGLHTGGTGDMIVRLA